MDGYGYSMDEAGLYLPNRREKRLQRMVHILIVAVLIQFLTTLILLVALGLHGQAPQHNQTMALADRPSPVISHRPHLVNPSTMLTAPRGKNTDGKYLLWESKEGIAHCLGGFSYSRGNLTVPRKGLYRIFLQINYSQHSKRLNEEYPHEFILLRHTVYSVSDVYPLDIALLSAEEKVSRNTSNWSKSLYTAGLYVLEANSILYVTSTHPELIFKDEKLVFFGAYLVSEHLE